LYKTGNLMQTNDNGTEQRNLPKIEASWKITLLLFIKVFGFGAVICWMLNKIIF